MKRTPIALAIVGLMLSGSLFASSHREAPGITAMPKLDGTDFYMFRSYETGRAGYVTFLANYSPLEEPNGGPNYYTLDPKAVYEIKVDTNGDALPDITYQFRFQNTFENRMLTINGVQVAVPLSNIGPFGTTPTANDGNKNVIETYTVSVLGKPNTTPVFATNATDGGSSFRKPFSNIGTKSIPDYTAYSNSHIDRISLPGCGEGRVFAGQRQEGFVIALGKVFDLIHLNPLGPPNANPSEVTSKNVTTIALEVPIACLTTGGSSIIGAWTTATLPRSSTTPLFGTQVSRLGAPLVNEVIIGLPDKDKFNASQPKDDAQFLTYVTNPTLPALIEALFPSVKAPTKFPRTDLIAAFLTGVPGLNKPANVKPAEMLRLNTSIAPKPAASQNSLAVLAGDTAGFPNGRRVGDDVVDIELRVAMGVLLPLADAPSGQLPYTDGAAISATNYLSTFPYLNIALPGATDSTAATAARRLK